MSTTAPEAAPVVPEMLASERWPFPWHRHNTRLLAANGEVVATFPTDLKTGATDISSFTAQISGVVERGNIIEQAVGKHSIRRNEWLEQRVATLETALSQSVSHWDSVISGEGEEFSNGAFDSVKDGLAEWRGLVAPKTVSTR